MLSLHHGRLFLPTPSARRATGLFRTHPDVWRYFYPRPPRGGRLVQKSQRVRGLGYFYPRPPRGGRPVLTHSRTARSVFLPTPSARRATAGPCPLLCHGFYFYPRPPRGGRPARGAWIEIAKRNFYPRPPRGGRHPGHAFAGCRPKISTHALREEGDIWRRMSPADWE